MIKEILVCLEGSPGSEAATQIAIEIAHTQPATLVGLAIVDEPDIRAGAATGIGGSSFKHDRDEALMADAHKHAADWLVLFERRCREANVTARPLEIVGRPADSILEEMESHDLTVLGRDANFRFETERDDAKTRETILHNATRPVLLVPETVEGQGEGQGAGAGGLGKVVLIAYDGSGTAKRAIASFAESGLAAGREVHVATVDDNGARAWEMANRAVQMLDASGIAARGHNVVSLLSNTDALFKLAGDLQAGMVVMGAFTRSRLREMFSGSVTRSLVEKTNIPLYLQH
jgi:nucleotide-binding universal stress UspA family protein